MNSLGLIPGHSYRFYVIVHDGDQNKTGGDAGQTCVDALFTGSSSSGTILTDSATISGGASPTGNVTFYLFAPGVTPNSNNSNAVYTDVVPVNGNGIYTTAMGNNPGGYPAAAAGVYQWVAVYSGGNNNNSVTSPYGSEPDVVSVAPCNDTYYPVTTSNQLTGVVFNESSMLAAATPTDGTTVSLSNGAIRVYVADETALSLGVSQLTTTVNGTTTSGSKTVTVSTVGLLPGDTVTGTGIPAGTTVTAVGTTTVTLSANATATGTAKLVFTTGSNVSVSPLPSSPGSVVNPLTGVPYAAPPTNLATVTPASLALQGGTDASGRPMAPSLFITDITGLDPNSVAAHAGDWQYGGTPISPSAAYGAWKSFTETIDETTATPTVTLTAGANPATNTNWNLGAGSTPPPAGTASDQYGAEFDWNISSLGLIAGHSYRFYVIVHDGDQNKTGGDAGQTCIDAVFTGATPPTVGPPAGGGGTVAKLNDSATLSGANAPTGNITFYLFAPGVTPNSNNSNAVYADVVPVNGNGTYTTAMGNNPGGYAATVNGTYQWVAVYGNDPNNPSVTSPYGSEPQTPPQVDLAIKKTDNAGGIFSATTNNTTGGNYFAGTTVTYTIVVTNNCPIEADNDSIADVLPAQASGGNWTFVSATGGATVTGSTSGSGALNTTANMPGGSALTFTSNVVFSSAASGIQV